MNTLTDRRRIKRLKKRAAFLMTEIYRRNDLDCGANLAEFIRPDISAMRAEFNKTLAELATIDPWAKALVDQHGEFV